MRSNLTLILAIAVAGAGLNSTGAIAQSYPVKPVKIISMATGVADGLTRMMAQKAELVERHSELLQQMRKAVGLK